MGGQQIGDTAAGKLVTDMLVDPFPDAGKQIDDVIGGGGRHGIPRTGNGAFLVRGRTNRTNMLENQIGSFDLTFYILFDIYL